MAKSIKTKLKLQLEAGKANPAPPVGTALGPHGVNIQDFCKKFNDATKDMIGDVVPAEITIYDDRTFDFILKTPPASALLNGIEGIVRAEFKIDTSGFLKDITIIRGIDSSLDQEVYKALMLLPKLTQDEIYRCPYFNGKRYIGVYALSVKFIII